MLEKLTGWKAYLAAALVIAALVALCALLLGWVADARERAKSAELKVTELATTISGYKTTLDQVKQRQAETDQTVAARMAEDAEMQRQLAALRYDLNGVMTDDPKTALWADAPIPDALVDRLWGGAGNRSGGSGSGAGSPSGGVNR